MSEKVWFITGASRGFGLDFTRAALASGDSVVATSRNPEDINRQIESSKALLTCPLDVTKPQTIADAVASAIDTFGRIDVLVNNAGYALIGALEECSPEEVEMQFRTNVFGLLDVTRAVLPHMRKRRRGHIVNMSSIAGLRGGAAASSYCGTKFAVEGISESLAQEVKAFGIRVTLIEPGYFRTSFLDNDSLRYARREIADYADTSGATRKAIPNVNGKQESDPRKLASVLLKIVSDTAPPLHFIAGNDAVKAAGLKIESLKSDLDAWYESSTSLAHD
jgi:NAD(P)-dependent dehydrogenase (short-subunit alcohol dehydrogenase family)